MDVQVLLHVSKHDICHNHDLKMRGSQVPKRREPTNLVTSHGAALTNMRDFSFADCKCRVMRTNDVQNGQSCFVTGDLIKLVT